MGALQTVFLPPARAGLNRTHVGASTCWITIMCWFGQWAAAGRTDRLHLSIAACWSHAMRHDLIRCRFHHHHIHHSMYCMQPARLCTRTCLWFPDACRSLIAWQLLLELGDTRCVIGIRWAARPLQLPDESMRIAWRLHHAAIAGVKSNMNLGVPCCTTAAWWHATRSV